jgi:hypothetical protein
MHYKRSAWQLAVQQRNLAINGRGIGHKARLVRAAQRLARVAEAFQQAQTKANRIELERAIARVRVETSSKYRETGNAE